MSFFSTTIKVPLSTLQEASDKLTQYASENDDIFDRLTNILEAMDASGEWKGNSMDAAIAKINDSRSKFEETIRDLNTLAEFLKDFTEKMSEKDAEIASQIKSVF